MRKVTFYIDDNKYFLEKYGVTEEHHAFKAIYTLCGTQNAPTGYKLTDYNGNKIDIRNLTSYERGVVLAECDAYYQRRVQDRAVWLRLRTRRCK